jgi:carboxyl-terminal processing protease
MMGTKMKNLGLIGLGMIAGMGASVQFSAIAQKSGAAPIPYEELQQLSEVFKLIKETYVEPTDDKKLLTDAMSGMVASLDPHSAYLDRKALGELRESTRGEFVGLGIEVSMEEGYVKVVTPIENSPAHKAGVKAGDLITRLDTAPVKGMSLDEAINRMRGEPGSKITLTIVRKDEDKPVVISLVRDRVKVQSVKAKVVEPGYAWLRITQFQEPTVKDMVEKLHAMYSQNPGIKGLVLDMRNDPGGVLQGAIGVSAAFLPKEMVVVSTNGQLAVNKRVYYGSRSQYAPNEAEDPLASLPAAVKTVPIVVLVNGGTASASEIVAGALQDHKRAIIMGTRTFGKGSVQTILPLEHPGNTGLKLTTARYFTPNGRSIQAKGIVPDMTVNERADGDDSGSYRLRESDLEKHLSNGGQNNGEQKPPEPASKKRDELEEEKRLQGAAKQRKPLEFGSKDDFQLAQALHFLKGEKVQLASDTPAKTSTSELKDEAKKPDGKKPEAKKGDGK